MDGGPRLPDDDHRTARATAVAMLVLTVLTVVFAVAAGWRLLG